MVSLTSSSSYLSLSTLCHSPGNTVAFCGDTVCLVLLGEFGWGRIKMQMLKGKANEVFVFPLSKAAFTLPALV